MNRQKPRISRVWVAECWMTIRCLFPFLSNHNLFPFTAQLFVLKCSRKVKVFCSYWVPVCLQQYWAEDISMEVEEGRWGACYFHSCASEGVGLGFIIIAVHYQVVIRPVSLPVLWFIRSTVFFCVFFHCQIQFRHYKAFFSIAASLQ